MPYTLYHIENANWSRIQFQNGCWVLFPLAFSYLDEVNRRQPFMSFRPMAMLMCFISSHHIFPSVIFLHSWLSSKTNWVSTTAVKGQVSSFRAKKPDASRGAYKHGPSSSRIQSGWDAHKMAVGLATKIFVLHLDRLLLLVFDKMKFVLAGDIL